jgi:hypothetical protein
MQLLHSMLAATETTHEQVVIVRTKNAFTFAFCYPYRHVQVIVKQYLTNEEVLTSFDLDCVAVGFDGTNVLALPRWRRAVNTRTNFVSLAQFAAQPRCHEARLHKYAMRGFGLKVCQTLQVASGATSNAAATTATADAILMHNATQLAKFMSKVIRVQFQQHKNDEACSSNNNNHQKSNNDSGALMYDSTYIPWGATWGVQQVLTHLKQRKQRKSKVPFFIVGSIEYCIEQGALLYSQP